MNKPIAITVLGTIVVLNALCAAWQLNAGTDAGLIVGVFNLGAGTFAAIVVGRILAD